MSMNSIFRIVAIMKSLFCLASILLIITPNLVTAAEKKVVICYYGTWAAYRAGLGKFEVTNIPTDLCTHLVYTFVGIDYSGNVVSLDPHLDYAEHWGKDNMRKFNKLKKTSPHLKTILAVGGFNEGSEKYSLMASNPRLRKNFITTAVYMLTKYGFDGLEVDWEFPNRRDTIYGQDDVDNFSQLLKEMREEFDKRGLLLTGAVAAAEQFAKLSYNVSIISGYLDWVSIMAYDMYGPWDPVTGHNAPLHKGLGDDMIPPEYFYSVDIALQYWLGQGCPPEKLVLGLPFYGRTFALLHGSHLRAPSGGPGLAGPYTQTKGIIGYNELCLKFLLEPWDLRQDDLAKVPYAVLGKNWVSYDDPNSLAAKVEFGLQYDIAGFMTWSIETDNFFGICGQGEFPLLKSVNAAIGRNGLRFRVVGDPFDTFF